MSVMISGSIAYDNILHYSGRFSDQFVAESLDHINLTFVTDSMIRNYGGCAANIAYGLKMLGGDPILTGAVGTDGSEYLWRLEEMLGIKTSVAKFNDCFTAQCFVTTDQTGAQLATFNPGAMLRSHEAPFPEGDIELAIVAPDCKRAMVERMNACAKKGIPVLFDIGQGVSQFEGSEIPALVEKATWMAASTYEMDLIARKSGLTAADIVKRVKAPVVTDGETGAVLYEGDRQVHIPACHVENALYPVGAGDAFRAGLIFGLTKGWDWVKIVRAACVTASFKVQSPGAQNFKFTAEEFAARYEATYGEAL